jgi:hypothetical protein
MLEEMKEMGITKEMLQGFANRALKDKLGRGGGAAQYSQEMKDAAAQRALPGRAPPGTAVVATDGGGDDDDWGIMGVVAAGKKKKGGKSKKKKK